jgi:hypothetical protein
VQRRTKKVSGRNMPMQQLCVREDWRPQIHQIEASFSLRETKED